MSPKIIWHHGQRTTQSTTTTTPMFTIPEPTIHNSSCSHIQYHWITCGTEQRPYMIQEYTTFLKDSNFFHLRQTFQIAIVFVIAHPLDSASNYVKQLLANIPFAKLLKTKSRHGKERKNPSTPQTFGNLSCLTRTQEEMRQKRFYPIQIPFLIVDCSYPLWVVSCGRLDVTREQYHARVKANVQTLPSEKSMNSVLDPSFLIKILKHGWKM